MNVYLLILQWEIKFFPYPYILYRCTAFQKDEKWVIIPVDIVFIIDC